MEHPWCAAAADTVTAAGPRRKDLESKPIKVGTRFKNVFFSFFFSHASLEPVAQDYAMRHLWR